MEVENLSIPGPNDLERAKKERDGDAFKAAARALRGKNPDQVLHAAWKGISESTAPLAFRTACGQAAQQVLIDRNLVMRASTANVLGTVQCLSHYADDVTARRELADALVLSLSQPKAAFLGAAHVAEGFLCAGRIGRADPVFELRCVDRALDTLASRNSQFSLQESLYGIRHVASRLEPGSAGRERALDVLLIPVRDGSTELTHAARVEFADYAARAYASEEKRGRAGRLAQRLREPSADQARRNTADAGHGPPNPQIASGSNVVFLFGKPAAAPPSQPAP